MTFLNYLSRATEMNISSEATADRGVNTASAVEISGL